MIKIHGARMALTETDSGLRLFVLTHPVSKKREWGSTAVILHFGDCWYWQSVTPGSTAVHIFLLLTCFTITVWNICIWCETSMWKRSLKAFALFGEPWHLERIVLHYSQRKIWPVALLLCQPFFNIFIYLLSKGKAWEASIPDEMFLSFPRSRA